MILDLTAKEFKLSSRGGSSGHKIGKAIVLALVYAAGFALLTYLYMGIDERICYIDEQVAFPFLCLYLTIAFVLCCLFTVDKARASLFSDLDRSLLSPLPIHHDDIIISKCIYFYLRLVVVGLLLCTSAIVAYAIRRPMAVHFYVAAILYPFMVSLPGVAVVSLLVLPYKVVYDFLKKHVWLQFALACVVVIGLCFVYRYVLDFFLGMLLGSRTDMSLAEPFLDFLKMGAPAFAPSYQYLGLVLGESLMGNLLILFGFVVALSGLGYMVVGALYKKALEGNQKQGKELPAKHPKVLSPSMALFKKESILLFRSSNYLFSFTSLLIMQPFLTFVVLSSLSEILYVQMRAYVTYFPELTNGVSLLIILLFSSLIGGAASDGYTREGRGRLYMKEIPVSPLKQVLIKMVIPYAVSVLSLLISNLVLLGFGLISVSLFFSSFFIGVFLIASLMALSLHGDAKKLSVEKKGSLGYVAGPVYAVGLPGLLILVHFLFVFLLPSIDPGLLYFIEVMISVGIAVPALLYFFLSHRKSLPEMRMEIL